MQKDFDRWNILKQKIENAPNNRIIKEGEVWWCSIGINIATESCGKGPEFRRPVLIIKKLSRDTCFIVPLSSKIKNGSWFARYQHNNTDYTALLYQMKMIHSNRLTKFEFKLDTEQFKEIKKRLKFLLNL